MAVFAHLNTNNIVVNILEIPSLLPHSVIPYSLENEPLGIDYCRVLVNAGEETTSDYDSLSNWKLSSNDGTTFRGNPVGIGMTYITGVRTLGVASTDIFIEQQPYPSWSIGVNTATWYSPLGGDISGPGITSTVELENDGKIYVWDESVYQADNTKGWVLE